jgi:hypothetical protein
MDARPQGIRATLQHTKSLSELSQESSGGCNRFTGNKISGIAKMVLDLFNGEHGTCEGSFAISSEA